MCKIIKGDNKKILPALIEDIKKLADKKGILYVTVLKTTKKEPPNSPFSIKLRL